jgi:hypothetical protein
VITNHLVPGIPAYIEDQFWREPDLLAHFLSQAGSVVGIVMQSYLCIWKSVAQESKIVLSCLTIFYIPMLSMLPIVLMCMRLLKKYRYYCRLKIKHILTVICLCVYYSSYSMGPINYTYTALQLGRTVCEGRWTRSWDLIRKFTVECCTAIQKQLMPVHLKTATTG